MRDYRPKYEADLASVSSKDVTGISAISKSDAEGHFAFTFSHPLLAPLSHVEIQVVPNEWSSYPAEHSFLAFAITEIPAALTEPLDNFVVLSSGLRVHEAVATLSQSFICALVGGSTTAITQSDEDDDQTMTDLDDGDEATGEEDDGFEDFDYNSDGDDVFGLGGNEGSQTPTITTAKVDRRILDRIRRDFRTARASGFKIGVLCGFEETVENNIVSLSVRVDKLCLSSETIEAWNLSPEDYIVLLIRYDRHYTALEDAYDRAAGLSNMKFRLRKCRTYKPSLQEALKAFHSETANRSKATEALEETESILSELNLLGIGQSIDTFMDADFVPLLKLRKGFGLSWDQATKQLSTMSRSTTSGQSNGHIAPMSAPMEQNPDVEHMKLPAFIARDHFKSNQELSLPLVAAQFAMRYFVRCTDYCMVCHQQVEGNFEALKPYVCGNSLCLFQYMSMGLGPSVNQEIRNQPNVVDLLISFCYAGLQVNVSSSAQGRGVRDFPTGLNLQVPKIFKTRSMDTYYSPNYIGPSRDFAPLGPSTIIQQNQPEEPAASVEVNGVVLVDPIKGILNMSTSTFELWAYQDSDKVKEGNWIAIVATQKASPAANVYFHGRVECIIGSTVKFKVVSVLPDATIQVGDNTDAHMVLYNQNLDDLDEARKAGAILMQLETIPSVATMRSYLAANPTQQIEKWDRLTPAASKLLRWIVASNRSYIVQVDECPTEDGQPEVGLARPQEHISGVKGWLQFRFAQGSPEKEIQFQEALQEVNKQYKTILAWHGSALSNWHSIIREGLDFKQTHNGRAYGHGVYFGHDFGTSLGYSGHGNYGYTYASTSGGDKPYWPNSILKISSAVSLNELVNLPEKFVTNNHFCMVVSQVHWIQCRCLFVQPQRTSPATKFAPPGEASLENTLIAAGAKFIQDPSNAAKGTSGNLVVPRGAIPTYEDQGAQRASMSLKQNALGHHDDSQDDDEVDRAFLTTSNDADDAGSSTPASSEGSAVILDESKTDFRPGALDLDTLPRLSPPDYATGQAQKTLAKELQKLQATQSSFPLHELGWFIDFDKITNMFHWIVELHSFDKNLLLAQDMKKAGVTSVVLELRFGRDFPYSPPFVRVIRPRFLPFAMGGGGHVTAGGAMCMELLTTNGWTPITSIEGVLVQVRMAITNTEPKPARLENTAKPVGRASRHRDYGINEAFDAYKRAAYTHGWNIPSDLHQAATEMRDETAAQNGNGAIAT
ncbi:hypothetical protein PG996_004613 [Apiospora saccharicola]|uniref:UBC core domain-containing protein n=1 Tax=Apiospora saccharicola TaxID=335842 RepID=A0ABR1W4R4_9PEZI